MNNKTKWWVYGFLGALFTGTGISVALEMSHLKQSSSDSMTWVIGGTLGIGCIITGIVLLIKAGILEYHMKEK